MTTYNDIQTIDQLLTRDDFEAHGADLASAFDVTEVELDSEEWELWRAGTYNQPALHVLWLPDALRAGILDGGDPVWTDATSVQDALERYFGDEDKEICN